MASISKRVAAGVCPQPEIQADDCAQLRGLDDVQPRRRAALDPAHLRVRHAGGAGHGDLAEARTFAGRSDFGSERHQMLTPATCPAITNALGHDRMVADGARLAISCGCSRCERSGASVRQPVDPCSEAEILSRPCSHCERHGPGRCRDARLCSYRERARAPPYHRREMCEHYVARATEPFRLDELWPFTERLERFGIAGCGWGASWAIGRRQPLLVPRRPGVPRRSGARRSRGESRRPRRSSTCGGPRSSRRSASPTPSRSTTRPAVSPSATTATSARSRRGASAIATRAGSTAGPTPRSERAGSRIAGTARPAGTLLHALHDQFRGQANLATISVGGDVAAYAGNTENPVFTFRLGRIGLASTGIYSLDRSLFRFVAPDATERRLVRLGGAVVLDRNGDAGSRRRRTCERGVGSRTRGPMRSGRLAVAADRRRVSGRAARPDDAPADLATSSRISLYWLGLTAIDGAVGLSSSEPAQLRPVCVDPTRDRPDAVPDLASPAAIVAILVQPTVGSISDYTVTPLGPPQAVHRDRLAARPRVPARHRLGEHASSRSPPSSSCSRSARTSPAGRSRATSRTSCRRPAGRAGERDGRAHAGPGQRHGVRSRRSPSLVGRIELAIVASAIVELSRCSAVVLRVATGRPREGPRGPSVARRSRARRGAPTSSASGAYVWLSRRASSS